MKRIFLHIVLLAVCGMSRAQSLPDKKVVHKNVLWLTVNALYRLNQHWGIQADASHRRTDWLKNHELSLIRIAPVYWIKPNLFAAIGYSHLWSQAGVGNAEVMLNENRLHEQVSLLLDVGKPSLAQRIRIEQRWREGVTSGAVNTITTFTQRYRYQATLNIPFGTKPSIPSLVIADEIMFLTGESVHQGSFDQNRFFIALNQPLGKEFSLEYGYMYTWQKSAGGNIYNSINTLRVTLAWNKLKMEDRRSE